MIIAFENDAIAGLLDQSMAAGAASVSDSSIRASIGGVVVVRVVDVGHQVGGQRRSSASDSSSSSRAVGGGRVAAGLDRLLGSGSRGSGGPPR